MDEKIISRPIRDARGRLIGNVTGRREQIEQVNNKDLVEQIARDNAKIRDNQKR